MVVSPDVTYSVVRVQGLKAARPRWRITTPTWPRIWARAMLSSSRTWLPARMVTNRVVLARLLPLTTSRARSTWASRMWLWRARCLALQARTARQERGWVWGAQTGSALRRGLRSLPAGPVRGVMVSMTCPSVKASPCQWKWASRSPGPCLSTIPRQGPCQRRPGP